ncbi:MAG: hemolysin [Salinivirgaceae bacterium]|nr:MAG: hemolysin [Salinivirgaceae bacterium]
MEQIVAPIPTELLEKELTPDKFVRKTNYGENEIYSFTYHNAPNLTREVGRIRELTFRSAGGGTGKSIDLDKFDMQDEPYHQLIVWSPEERIILGGYRYIVCNKATTDEEGVLQLATYRLFNFSDQFINDYLPYTIELGRSFVHPDYQSSKSSRKGIFALDNLWDGLGALVVNHPETKYFFGKVTMYPHFNTEARNMILYFLQKQFADNENLMSLIEPMELGIDYDAYDKLFIGNDFKENWRILNQNVRQLGENIPPLINAYMNLSPTMRTFGTSYNKYFGGVEETAIMINIQDIYPTKIERHVDSYIKEKA